MHRPYDVGARRIGQLGDNTEQLAMKVAGPVLVTVRPVRDERYDRAFRAGQPGRDVAIVVENNGGDFPGPDDFGSLIIGHPHIWRVHVCLPC